MNLLPELRIRFTTFCFSFHTSTFVTFLRMQWLIFLYILLYDCLSLFVEQDRDSSLSLKELLCLMMVWCGGWWTLILFPGTHVRDSNSAPTTDPAFLTTLSSPVVSLFLYMYMSVYVYTHIYICNVEAERNTQFWKNWKTVYWIVWSSHRWKGSKLWNGFQVPVSWKPASTVSSLPQVHCSVSTSACAKGGRYRFWMSNTLDTTHWNTKVHLTLALTIQSVTGLHSDCSVCWNTLDSNR